jgi:hypothetical protein
MYARLNNRKPPMIFVLLLTLLSVTPAAAGWDTFEHPSTSIEDARRNNQGLEDASKKWDDFVKAQPPNNFWEGLRNSGPSQAPCGPPERLVRKAFFGAPTSPTEYGQIITRSTSNLSSSVIQ